MDVFLNKEMQRGISCRSVLRATEGQGWGPMVCKLLSEGPEEGHRFTAGRDWKTLGPRGVTQARCCVPGPHSAPHP